MARLDVPSIISQWVHHMETDSHLMDKFETTYRSQYEAAGSCEEERAECCVPCQCVEACSVRAGQEDGESSALAEFTFQCGCVEECYTFQGRRVGRSRRRRCDGSVTRTDFRRGVRQGFSLRLSSAGRLETAGWWRGGGRANTWWTAVRGGAWLVTNTNTDQAIFLYPDLVTALLGNINPEDLTAREDLAVCQVTSLSLEAGIILPGLTRCHGTIPAFRGKLCTFLLTIVSRLFVDLTKSVLHQPEVRDPYESKMVEVRQSSIPHAGDGLFVRAAVEKGVLVAYFAGVVVEAGDCAESEYSISWQGGARLDIPAELRELQYCATLGHKACHSFSPNCEYSWAVHPRFGHIRAIVSLRRLEPEEEILTDYKYSYSKAPQWYRQDLTNFLINNFNMETRDITEYINRMEEDRKCA